VIILQEKFANVLKKVYLCALFCQGARL